MTVEVRGQQTTNGGRLLKTDLYRPQPPQPGSAVISAGIGACKRAKSSGKHVEGDVVSIRPHTQLGIVIKAGILKGVAIIGSCRIRCGGYCNALEKRNAPNHELRENPTISQLVVGND